MKRIAYFLLSLVLALSLTVPALALDGQVIYTQNSKKFIFLPGGKESPTDLFPEFKDVMPGDKLEQKILLKNDISNNCKVKVYMRALGAHPNSKEFLSQLQLTVHKGTDTELFKASADATAQLSDWVYLGTLYSGGQCELSAVLDVPVTLDNQFKQMIGFLDWEFAVEELPIEPTDPEPPKTGDETPVWLWLSLLAVSACAIIVLIAVRKKKEED